MGNREELETDYWKKKSAFDHAQREMYLMMQWWCTVMACRLDISIGRDHGVVIEQMCQAVGAENLPTDPWAEIADLTSAWSRWLDQSSVRLAHLEDAVAAAAEALSTSELH